MMQPPSEKYHLDRATKVASFDVFDTCLVRRVAVPTEVFRLIGSEAARLTLQSKPTEFAEQFVHWRCEAERRVRQRGDKEDVRLQEIWDELRLMLGGEKIGAFIGPELELAAERSVLGPVEMMKQLVNRARLQYHRIIYISDMYLPSQFVKECLKAHGFIEEKDEIYVSGDIGLTKYSGNLFKHVLKVQGLSPFEMHHLGDNYHSDVEIPRRLGVSAEIFVPPKPHPVEDFLLKKRPVLANTYINTVGHLRFNRMSLTQPISGQDHSIRTFVEGFLGPVLCLFVHWVLRRAQKDGIERVYFVSRDARLSWTVGRGLQAQGSNRTDCRYLHISRQAIFLPSAWDVSPSGMPWLLRPGDPCLLPDLLAKLELTYDEFIPHWKALHPSWRREEEITTAEQRASFWHLLQTAPFRARIEFVVEKRRLAALEYFARIGLLDSVPAAIVDLGSLLYCQEALNSVCSQVGSKKSIRGYYLFLRGRRRGWAEAGLSDAVVYEPAADLNPGDFLAWINRSGAIEHFLGLADHSSVRAYEPGGSVSFSNSDVPNMKIFRSIESELIKYVENFGDCWTPLSSDDLAATAISILMNDFLERPPLACLPALREVTCDALPLIQPLNWKEVLVNFLPNKLRMNHPFFNTSARLWPEASMLATPRHLRNSYRGGRLAHRLYSRLGFD